MSAAAAPPGELEAMIGRRVALTLLRHGLAACGRCEKAEPETFARAAESLKYHRYVLESHRFGHVGRIEAGANGYPMRLVCECCGVHRAWFGLGDLERLARAETLLRAA